jgi:hypothetical protein
MLTGGIAFVKFYLVYSVKSTLNGLFDAGISTSKKEGGD